ncbi:MAG: alkaline phosphatase D family protein [Deltaproteobacteria bacterium]|nr:alkaline phosphatase D family protein [Deltaproteobacteria bacterium]
MTPTLPRRELLVGVSSFGASAALGGCATSPEDVVPLRRRHFLHGVASGDPLPAAVILWTRVTPDVAGPVTVTWEIATDPSFATIVGSGIFVTDAERDFTVKVDAVGLAPATSHFYRFEALGERSVIGRTRTAPSVATSRLRFAVASCSSYAHGYFHAYRALANRADLDAVLHLGDYLYEYASGEYGKIRDYDPPHATVTLEDYRRRYAHYRRDADLQAVHRQHPFLCVWDDHEFANNAHRTGAENHTPGLEGSFEDRKRAAIRAHAEWMPFREQAGGRIYRSFAYGDLAEIFLLDTRVWGRSLQVETSNDPSLADPAHTILGEDQEEWLAAGLAASKARYKLVGQQVVMAHLKSFFNGDAWDGYPGSRARLFDVIETGAIDDVVVLTGDIHASFASELARDPYGPGYEPVSGKGALAVEFVTPGISSPGFPPALANLAATATGENRHIKYAELTLRGYVVLDLDPQRLQAAWFHYDDVVNPDAATESFARAYRLATGSRHLVEDGEPATPTGEIPTLAPAD